MAAPVPIVAPGPTAGFYHDPCGHSPIWNLAQAEARAREVEAVLQGEQFEQYLAHMYGNEPSRWSVQLVGPERWRSEEHTSELQSRGQLVCRLLLEKKKQT